MGLSAILQSAFFDSRFKFGVHIVQVVFITIAIILSIVRISMPLPQRAHIMGIAIVSYLSFDIEGEFCIC